MVSLNFDKKGTRFNTTFGGLVSILLKMIVIWYLVVKVTVYLTTTNNVYSSQVTHPNGDFDLPLVSLDKMKVLPYYQIFDWKMQPVEYNDDIQRYLGFEIIIHAYESNKKLLNDFTGVRLCTREDFAGIEHVFDTKSQGNGNNTLICPENLSKLSLRDSIAHTSNQTHFNLIITECNPNTFKGECENDNSTLQAKYERMRIQLNFVS